MERPELDFKFKCVLFSGALQVCTLCANEGLVAAGGFNGEVVARRIGAAEKISARWVLIPVRNDRQTALRPALRPALLINLKGRPRWALCSLHLPSNDLANEEQ